MRELLQQGRLAHTRLAFDQDEPAFTATRLRRDLGQCVQRRLPLEQCYPAGALLRRVRRDQRERGVGHLTSSVLRLRHYDLLTSDSIGSTSPYLRGVPLQIRWTYRTRG